MKKTGIAVAAMVSWTAATLLIGILFILAESNDPVHDFLDFFPPMGPLSGKIIISYSFGLVFFLGLGMALKNRNPSIKGGLLLSIILLLIATLFSYVPFIKLII